MSWINQQDVLHKLLDEARRDAERLGHVTNGWGPTEDPSVYSAACPLCWATGTVTVRRLGCGSTSGALLILPCQPEEPPLENAA